jgi:hypothetical protein
MLVNRQATDAHGGDSRIRREVAYDLGWKVGQSDVASREGVEATDRLGILLERDIARHQAAADVLRNLMVKVSIERLDPAAERPARPVTQGLGTERSSYQAGPVIRL